MRQNSFDPVIAAFISMLKSYSKFHMRETALKLTSPTDISFQGRPVFLDDDGWNLINVAAVSGKKQMSVFKDDDEVIFYAILDYPFEFSCCHIKDFRQAYLNARSFVKVELLKEYHEYGDVEHVIKESYYTTEANRCVPLWRGCFKDLSQFRNLKMYENTDELNGYKYACDYDMGLDGEYNKELDDYVYPAFNDVLDKMYSILNSYFYSYVNYLIYCNEFFSSTDGFNLGLIHDSIEEVKFNHSFPKRVMNGFVKELDGFDPYKRFVNWPFASDCGFFIPCKYKMWENYSHLSKSFRVSDIVVSEYQVVEYEYPLDFCGLLDLAKKVRKDTALSSNSIYGDMLDIDELYIYDLYKRFHNFVDLEFLKKDWYNKPSWE